VPVPIIWVEVLGYLFIEKFVIVLYFSDFGLDEPLFLDVYIIVIFGTVDGIVRGT
jgi:hypothetical protein